MSAGEVVHKPFGLLQATSIVMVATLAASLFGLVREGLVAAYFGTTVTADAYFFAFDLAASLPEFLLSAIGACLIPLYARSKKEGSAGGFVSTIINVYLLMLLLVAVLTISTASYLVPLLASGFSLEGQQLITSILRMLAPAVVLIGLWGVFKTLLNAEGNFFVSTFSQALQSMGIIGAIFFLAPQLGIFSLPIGILTASVFQVLWTAYCLKQKGFEYRLEIHLRDPQFRYYLVLLVPSLFGALIGYVEPIFDKSLASHMEEGTIAALSFAGRPMAILTRFAVYSFVTALLPVLSWESLHGNKVAFKASVLRILNMLMFAIIPLSLLLIALRVPIIQLLFERGKFETQATEVTSTIFAALVLGLMPMAASVTLSSVFIAQEDTRTPALWGAGSSVIAKIVLSLVLIAPLGVVGLALATSLKSLVTSGLLLYRLRDRLDGIDGGYLLKAFGRILCISLVAVSPLWFIKMDFDLSPFVSILVGSSIAVSLYALLSIILRTPEIAIVRDFLPGLQRT